MSCESISMLDGAGGTGCIVPVHGCWDSLKKHDALDIEKLLLKKIKLNKLLHSEVNLLIQHIIVQDQDGQNNNI